MTKYKILLLIHTIIWWWISILCTSCANNILFIKTSIILLLLQFSGFCQYTSVKTPRLINNLILYRFKSLANSLKINNKITYLLRFRWILWLILYGLVLANVWNLQGRIPLLQNDCMHSINRTIIIASGEEFFTLNSTCNDIADQGISLWKICSEIHFLPLEAFPNAKTRKTEVRANSSSLNKV